MDPAAAAKKMEQRKLDEEFSKALQGRDIADARRTIFMVDADGRGPGGLRWMTMAAMLNFPEAIALLGKVGAPTHGHAVAGQPQGNFTTPLIQAAKSGYAACVLALIEQGAEVDEVDSDGHTALSAAEALGRDDCREALIQRGASSLAPIRMLPEPEPALDLAHVGLGIALAALDAIDQLEAPGILDASGLIDGALASSPAPKPVPTPFGILAAACAKGDADKLAQALARHPDHLDGTTAAGIGLLSLAAKSASNRCVEMLLEAGIDPDEADRDGWTVAIKAAKEGWAECLRLVLEHGADPDWRSHGGDTPLRWSARNRHRNCSRLLLAAGAKLSTIDPSLTGEQIEKWADAIKAGAFELMEADVEALNFLPPEREDPAPERDRRAEPDSAEDAGVDLLTAAWKGNGDLLGNALARGAPPDFWSMDGETALMLAAKRGRLEMMSRLIDAGALREAEGKDGRTTMHIAAAGGWTSCARLLSERRHGANSPVELRDRFGLAPLALAAQSGALECIKAVRAEGARVDAPDSFGRSPLSNASIAHKWDLVEFLKPQGAGIDEVDHDGWSPLGHAAAQGHLQAIRMLSKLGADMSPLLASNRQAISSVCAKGDSATLCALMESGMDFHSPSQDPYEPASVFERHGVKDGSAMVEAWIEAMEPDEFRERDSSQL